jgi:hypothetical protein
LQRGPTMLLLASSLDFNIMSHHAIAVLYVLHFFVASDGGVSAAAFARLERSDAPRTALPTRDI